MSKAMRIAIVSPRFAEGATVGGAETLLKNFALRLADAGHRVNLLTTCATDHIYWSNELPEGEREFRNIKVTFFPVNDNRDVGTFLEIQERISRGVKPTRSEEEIWLTNSVNSSKLCEYLEQHGDELDHIIMGPYLFGLIYHAAQIYPHKTALIPCLHDEPFAYLACFNEMFQSVGRIIFNSKPEQELARRLYSIENQETSVVGMGLEPFDADPETFSRKYNLTEPYLVYSGRREGLKGTPRLIDYVNAFRKRTGRGLKLVLTGSGHIELPVELVPHVIDLGFVSEREKQEAMAGAVAFCHPSEMESFGIVVLESWLARTPTLVNAKSEVLRFQCQESNGGLWFNNYPEFEEELLLLLTNKNFRDQLGDNGRNYVMSEYSWKAIDQKIFLALGM